MADTTFYQTLELTKAPVIASHFIIARPDQRAAQHDRRLLRALAKNNGVAQANFYCAFVSQKYFDTAKKLGDEKDPDYMMVQELFVKPQTPEIQRQIIAAKARLAPKYTPWRSSSRPARWWCRTFRWLAPRWRYHHCRWLEPPHLPRAAPTAHP